MPRVEFLPCQPLRTPVGEAAASLGCSVRAWQGDAALSEMSPAVSIPSKELTGCGFSGGTRVPGSWRQLPAAAENGVPAGSSTTRARCEETRPSTSSLKTPGPVAEPTGHAASRIPVLSRSSRRASHSRCPFLFWRQPACVWVYPRARVLRSALPHALLPRATARD